MTFEEFQATRMPCADLGFRLDDARWLGEPPAKGNVYLDVLYIEEVMPHWPEAARKAGKWCLLIGNDQWISDDLTALERDLYEWAKAEGYFTDPATCSHRDDGRGFCIDCGAVI